MQRFSRRGVLGATGAVVGAFGAAGCVGSDLLGGGPEYPAFTDWLVEADRSTESQRYNVDYRRAETTDGSTELIDRFPFDRDDSLGSASSSLGIVLLDRDGAYASVEVYEGTFDVDAVTTALSERASRLESIEGMRIHGSDGATYAIGPDAFVLTAGDEVPTHQDLMERTLATHAGRHTTAVESDEDLAAVVERFGDPVGAYCSTSGGREDALLFTDDPATCLARGGWRNTYDSNGFRELILVFESPEGNDRELLQKEAGALFGHATYEFTLDGRVGIVRTVDRSTDTTD